MRLYFAAHMIVYTALITFPASSVALDWKAEAKLPGGDVVPIDVEVFLYKPGEKATPIHRKENSDQTRIIFDLPDTCSDGEVIKVNPQQDKIYGAVEWRCKKDKFESQYIELRRELTRD